MFCVACFENGKLIEDNLVLVQFVGRVRKLWNLRGILDFIRTKNIFA